MMIANRITEKAAELFNLYGIKRITVDEIAASAGISKKILNSCFVNKTAIVEAVVDEMLAKNQNGCMLIKKQSDDAIGELYLLVNYLEKFYSSLNGVLLSELSFGYPIAYEKVTSHQTGFLAAQIKSNIRSGIEENLYRKDLDAEIAAYFILQNLLLMNKAGLPMDSAAVKSHMIGQLIWGLVNEKGAARIEQFKQFHSLVKQERNDYSPLWDH